MRPSEQSNIRRTGSAFVGRNDLLATVIDKVGAHRLVTLTGAGGVGKTRLAVETAVRMTDVFRDGVWFVDLASVGDPWSVPDAIATTLGVLPQAGTTLRDQLLTAVAGQQVLLVLDNCEHLVDAAADIVGQMLARGEGSHVLVTSRQPLLAVDEFIVSVPPLPADGPTSPAVVLFTERAQSVRPNFSIEDHPSTLAAVVEICRTLDGLPLGIELAASRMAGMSVADIRERLADRFRLLAADGGTAPRQRSLDALVRWSYELLDQAQRDLLMSASVFAGGFDLVSLCGVIGEADDTTVLRQLDRLVRSSLVVAEHADGSVRYRLLETVRQFGVEELAGAGRLDEVRRQHAAWFARSVTERWEAHFGPGWGASMRWLRTELSNLRAAFDWSRERDLDIAVDIAAHAGLVGTSANLFEPIAWAERLVDAAIALSVRRLPRLLCACGYACFAGRAVAAAAHAEHAMRIEDDPRFESCEPGLAAFIAALANVYAGQLDRYVELARAADSVGGASRAFARPALADGLQASGHVDEAVELLPSAIAAARYVGSPFWLTYALWTAGVTLSNVDRTRALAAWDEGLNVAGEHDVEFFRGFLARDAARLHSSTGDADQALAQFDVAIEAFHRAGNVPQLIITLASFPTLLLRIGDQAGAATLRTAMLAIPTSIERVPELADLGERLEAGLGAAAAAAVATGHAMTLDDAVSFARQVIALNQTRRVSTAARPGGLSHREVEVLRLLTEGLSTREMADRLFISVKTADRHIQNIYTKIGTSTRATATRWAIEHQLVAGRD